METQPKTNQKMTVRRLALCSTLLAVTGCAGNGPSLASLNPFSKQEAVIATLADAPEPDLPASMTGSLSTLAQGTRGQVSSMGSAVKSAYSKTTGSVAGLFKGRNETVDETGNKIPADDPLRLDNKPASIGPEVFVANGQLWESTGNMEKAMENYAKALQSEPDNAPALASVARLHFRQSRHAEAVQYFQRAIKSAPNDAALYHDLGATYSAMGQHDQAAKSVQNALAIAPGTARYANTLAKVQFAAGRADAALATLTENNKPAVAHFNMAYLYFDSGAYDQARVQLGEALKYEPQAAEDGTVRRAIDRSKELLAQLDGPANQAAQIAQAAPQAVAAAKQAYQTTQQAARAVQQVSQQVPGAAGGTTDAASPAAATTKAAATAPAPAAASAGVPFQLPADFLPSQPRTASGTPSTVTR